MMPEISLNILDIVQNSVRAKASLIQISIIASTSEDTLTVIIEDNGCGMSREQLQRATDPFFTTRTTRMAGLGVPFFKLAAESSDGEFDIQSEQGKGTVTKAVFGLSNIDRMPLGDINGTVYMLVTRNTDIDFVYLYKVNDRSFVLDTREFRAILGDVPLDSYEVSGYIKEYLNENKLEADGGLTI